MTVSGRAGSCAESLLHRFGFNRSADPPLPRPGRHLPCRGDARMEGAGTGHIASLP
jgi:hypothetical protein